MTIALVATIFGPQSEGTLWIIIAMIIGGVIGVQRALKVEMTEMPELVCDPSQLCRFSSSARRL